ncbi:hypothetical protein M9H77_31623 [Catharanthus roseus]|uniref:Uncharacterized protein n=1 Tax=Catharanthus roseus TaxID=4058 RepID=A0ACC0A4I2_CATRO|nr:hypothetical protein M9H77_31623 [Catharanthus roseus]
MEQIGEELIKERQKQSLLSTVGLVSTVPGRLLSKWILLAEDLPCALVYNVKVSTRSHQEGTSDPTRMNLNETLQSMQQSIEDVEDLKKGKGSATIEKRVGENLGGVHLPHHQRVYDNVPPFGCQGRQPTTCGRRGDLGGRGYNKPQEDIFLYVMGYKKDKENVVADALSRRHTLIFTLQAQILGFEILEELYASANDFKGIFDSCLVFPNEKYLIHGGFLYHEGELCIPPCSSRLLLVKEAHCGGLMDHFDHLHHLKQVFFFFFFLRNEKLYANLGKYEFFFGKGTFLGYAVSSQVLQIDEYKANVIKGMTGFKWEKLVYLLLTLSLDGKKKAEFFKSIHSKSNDVIEANNKKGGHIKKERFPSQQKSKLEARGDGFFQVLERFSDKANKLIFRVNITLVLP